MTHLRKMLLDKLQRPNYSKSIPEAYICALRDFAAYYHLPPDWLGRSRYVIINFIYCVRCGCHPSAGQKPPYAAQRAWPSGILCVLYPAKKYILLIDIYSRVLRRESAVYFLA
jgi:hypothetical protein